MEIKRFQRVLRRAILVPLAIAGVLIIILIAQIRFLEKRTKWVQHADQVISLAERIYRIRIDQETSVRAYLLTRDLRFLELYVSGQNQAHALEQQLQQMTRDNPEQRDKNQLAVTAHQAWAAWAEQAITRAGAGQHAQNPDLLRGKELMDHYRDARAVFINREEQLREQRLAASERAYRATTWGIIGIGLVIGVILAVLESRQVINLSAAFDESLEAAHTSAAEATTRRKWLSTVLNSIGDAVIATDTRGTIMFMNPVAGRLTGWKPNDARGRTLRSVFQIVDPETHERAEDPIEKVRRTANVVDVNEKATLLSRNGEEFSIADSAAPIRAQDSSLSGVVLVFRDVTQQRRLEAALRSNERLALAGRLSAAIAHEINNPLDTVINLLFLLNEKTKSQPDLHPLIDRAQQEAHRVTEIAKNMLSLHRASRKPTGVDLSKLLSGVVALIDETLAKGRRKIRVEHGFGGTIHGFPGELRQVFTNVIKNAVEATGEGGEILVASRSAVEGGHSGVRVDIADNGPGISPELRERLFTPFMTTKDDSGTGLGLWVSRSIVEKHGGSIILAEGPGLNNTGTTVSIFLPLEPVSVSSAPNGSSRAKPASDDTLAA